MMSHDVSRGFGGSLENAAKGVKTRMLVVVATQDHMVNPIPATRFAKLIGAPVLELVSDCGHLSPGCEAAKMASKVREWLGN